MKIVILTRFCSLYDPAGKLPAGRSIYGDRHYQEERYMRNDKKNRSFAAVSLFVLMVMISVSDPTARHLES